MNVEEWKIFLADDSEFWVSAFDSEVDAVQFCEDVGLVIVEGINE